MRFSILQDNLNKNLALVSAAVSTRPTLPILANVLLTAVDGRLKLSATNLEIGIVVRVGCKVDQDGTITVPAKTINDFVKSLPEERIDAVLNEKNNKLGMKVGEATSININGISADDYPIVPEYDGEDYIEIPSASLIEAIDHVKFSAAPDDNRPVLTGIFMRFENDTLTMASSDGYRLTVRIVKLDQYVQEVTQVVVPNNSLQQLAKILKSQDDLTVQFVLRPNRGQAMFHTARVDLVTALIEGQYPAVEQIIPKTHDTEILVNVESFLAAAKRQMIFARDTMMTMQMDFALNEDRMQPDLMVLESASTESGDSTEHVQCVIKGEAGHFALNVNFVIQILTAIKEEFVVITASPLKPVVFTPQTREDFIHIIMPMTSKTEWRDTKVTAAIEPVNAIPAEIVDDDELEDFDAVIVGKAIEEQEPD